MNLNYKNVKKGTLAFIAMLSLLFLNPIFGSSQYYATDGNNCNATNGVEWALAAATLDTDIKHVNGSSNLEKFWAGVDGPNYVLAMEREAGGNASFAIHLDVDCDATNNDNGADMAIFFNISKVGGVTVIGNKIIYEYNSTTSTYDATTKTFIGEMGESVCTDVTTKEEFFEISVALSDIFDLCNDGGASPACGSITVTQGSANAGGVFNSALKDSFPINTNYAINFVPTADISLTDSVACRFDEFNLNGLASLDGDEANNINDFNTYQWDVDYTGSFSEDFTGANPTTTFSSNGLHKVALIVTDVYGCKDTAVTDIDVYGTPSVSAKMLVYPSIAPVCQIALYDGSNSYDSTGLDNLIYNWDFGDGFSSNTATGSHPYPDCNVSYNAVFTAVDPDNNGNCPAAPVLFLIPLPVDLISFDATVNAAGKNTLNWVTASEQNNHGFYILKSTDGFNWSEVDFVEGSGNSNVIVSYQWNDMGVNKSGAVYYKLKQEDFNGTTAYSETRSVTGQKTINPIVYPNPVESILNINLGVINESQMVKIDIVNQFGQSVLSATQIGVSVVTLSANNFASGIYYAKVDVNGVVFTHKFLKK